MAIQLDDLVARLRLDTQGIGQGLGSVNSQLESVGGTSKRVGTKLSLGLTTPLVAIGAAGVSLAASFDRTMRQVGVATDEPTAKLRELALQMGQETVFSASEAADAMLELAKGGMTAAQIRGGVLASTMRLATVGQTDLATASAYTTTAMNQFGLKAKDTDQIVVALAGAANKGTASVDSLAQGLGNVGGVARNMGLSLQETTGVLSLLDQAGLKGAEGGTALRSMLNGLTPTSTKAKTAMKELGLSFTDSEGNFRSIAAISQQLQDKLAGQTEAQRAATLETIFGSYGQQAATALMKAGRGEVEAYTKAAKDQKTTQELANAQMEGTAGAIERAKGSIETATLLIGDVLAPYVERAAGLIELLANKFSALPGNVQGMIVAGGALLAIIGPLLVGFGILATTIAAIGLPVIAVVAGIGALVAVLAAAYMSSETFRAGVATAFAGVQAVFAQLWAAVQPIVQQIVGVFVSQMPLIRSTVASVFGSIKSIVLSAMSIISSIIRIATNVIGVIWRAAGSNILAIIRTALQTVLGVVRGAFTILQGIFRTVAAILKGDWSGAWEGIKQILRGAWQVIISVLKGSLRILWETIKGGLKLAVATIKELPGLITGALKGVGTLLLSAGKDIIGGLIEGITSKFDELKDKLSSVTKLIPDWKGPPSTDKTLLVENAKLIMGGFNREIAAGADETRRVLQGLTASMSGDMTARLGSMRVGTASSAGAEGAPSVRVFIGERELTDIVRVEFESVTEPLRTYARQGVYE